MRSPQYIAAIDGMRGVAALLVLMYHVKIYFNVDQGWWISGFFYDHAYLMVDAFLVISGFVIAHVFDRRMSGRTPVRDFMLRRVVRLYPMIVVGVAVGSGVLVAWQFMTPGVTLKPVLLAIASALCLVPTTSLVAFKGFLFPVNSAHWSLSMEMVLYVAYALWICRCGPVKLAVALALSGLGLLVTSRIGGGLDVGYLSGTYLLAFGRVAYPFLAGVAIRRSRWFRPSSQRHGYLAIPVVVGLAVNPIPTGWLYDAIASLVVLPLLVGWIANTRPVAILDAWSRRIGDLSYPIYAIHFPIVVAVANVVKLKHLGPVGTDIAALVCCVVVVVSAHLVYRYYDVPLRRSLASGLGFDRPRPVGIASPSLDADRGYGLALPRRPAA